MKERLLTVLASLREGRIAFDEFRARINEMVSDGILAGFEGYERSRVSEFIWRFDCYDANVPAADSFLARWKMTSKRVRGEPGYPKEQIIEEALALEQCLLEKESLWQRIRRFFTVR